jgi:hypothetical protein
MKMLGSITVLLISVSALPAAAQSLAPLEAAAGRLTPSDGRLDPLLPSPGASRFGRDAGDMDPQAFEMEWRGDEGEWNLSAASRLVEESRANAADFQTQGLFETEAALVRKIGDFRIGAAGYSARGVGDKGKQAPRLGAMRWQGSAVGPVVGYDTNLAGRPATVSLRWYREIDAPGENGDTVSASFNIRF